MRIREEDEMSKAEEVEEKVSEIIRNADRNRAIQAMMTDGEKRVRSLGIVKKNLKGDNQKSEQTNKKRNGESSNLQSDL